MACVWVGVDAPTLIDSSRFVDVESNYDTVQANIRAGNSAEMIVGFVCPTLELNTAIMQATYSSP
jgi:hypothetical protein